MLTLTLTSTKDVCGANRLGLAKSVARIGEEEEDGDRNEDADLLL